MISLNLISGAVNTNNNTRNTKKSLLSTLLLLPVLFTRKFGKRLSQI